MKPPPKLTISQWADTRRVLSPESSAEGGSRWRTDRAEYLRGIMDAVSDKRVEDVTLMGSSQIGKTEVICNIIGYHIDQDPSPMLDVEPTDSMARTFSIDRIAPMIRDTACLHAIVSEPRARNSHNTILEKTYPGGTLNMIGANSPAQLAGRPKRIVLANDVDRFPPSAGSEGDPLELAIKRTRTFWNRKIFINSTPTTRDISKIEERFFLSSQNHFYVPCPLCSSYQKLIFGPKSQFANLARGMIVYKWDGSKITEIAYRCGNCEKDIPEQAKYKMVRMGQWRPLFPDRIRHQGFHMNELYSPWSSWREIAEGFEKSKHRIEKLRVWINTTAGETFNETENPTLSGDKFMDRREEYDRRRLPLKIVILTAAVDVQPDRLECYVEGWGPEEENWLVDFYVAEGSPDKAETWKFLEVYLFNTEWVYENGYKAGFGQIGGLMAVGVDTGGYNTTSAYKWVKKHKRKRIFALKGMAGFGRRIIEETKNKKVRVRLQIVGVDEAKQIVYDRLANDVPGPGYYHFNKRVEKDYFEQLLSERKFLKVVRGRKVVVWDLIDKNRANEGLDCKVYNLSMYRKLNPNITILAQTLRERMEAAGFGETPITPAKDEYTGEQSDQPTPPAKPKSRRKRLVVKSTLMNRRRV